MESTQKQIVIGLAVIAVLLAAIVGVLLWKSNSVPAPTVSGNGSTDTGANSSSTMPQTSTSATAAAAAFDPKTAPKVPSGQTPEQYVKAYYQACQDGDYAKAYKMLPTATQSYYGDETQFASTIKSYAVSEFSVSPQKTVGDKITVVGAQTAQGMQFPYTWSFVKGSDGTWLVESRTMGAQ